MLHIAMLLSCSLALALCSARVSASPDVGESRPRVLLDASEVARLREELRTSKRKQEIYNSGDGSTAAFAGGVKTIAEYWRKRDVAIPARGGHWHNFFCECGSVLEMPEDHKPRPSYRCGACGKRYSGEKYDGAVRNIAHHQLSVASFACALVGALENDKELLSKAAEILKDYAEAYPGPHTSILEGGIIYQSLDESVWSIPLASAYDLLLSTDALTEAESMSIRDKLLRPIGSGLMKMGIGGNWGSWHLSATGVIGYATGDSELIDYAVRSFKSQITNQLGSDGLWPESVHTYHFYPLGAFLYMAEAARHNGEDLWGYQAGEKKCLRAMFTEPLEYAYPDLRLPAINDGWFASFIPLDQYELAFARFKDPGMGWVVSDGYRILKSKPQGLWALLQGQGDPESFPRPQMRSATFPVLGIATLRSPGGSMMTFDYGPFLGHGQLDKMGITLFAQGRLMAADYGTVGYGSPIIGWYTGTFSHNTVVVDGKPQQRTRENLLTHTAHLKNIELLSSETSEACPGVRHRRSVARVGEAFVVVDDLESDAEHTFDNYFHCEGKLSVQAEGRAVAGAVGLLDAHIAPSAVTSADGQWKASWAMSDAELTALSPLLTASQVIQATCPGRDANNKVPLLIERKAGKRARFVRLLIPHKKAAEPDYDIRQTGSTVAVTIRETGSTARIRFERADDPGAAQAPYSILFRDSSTGRTESLSFDGQQLRGAQ